MTDCPLPLSSFYGHKYKTINPLLDELIFSEFNKFNNLNFFLKRTVPFEKEGRIETEEQSNLDSTNMKTLLSEKGVDYIDIEDSEKTIQILKILNILGYIKYE